MLISFLVMIFLLAAVCVFAQTKLGIRNEDINLMFLGVVAFGAVENIAKILVGLFVGMTMAQFLAYFVALLINVAVGYYFYTKSGL